MHRNCTRKAQELFKEYCDHFQVDAKIISKCTSGRVSTVGTVLLSSTVCHAIAGRWNSQNTVLVNIFSPKENLHEVYDSHLSYITDVNMYSHQYVCAQCNKLFSKMRKLKQHQPKCDGAVKYMYPGGVYKNKPTIIEELEQIGARVNEEDKCEKWYACDDFEAYHRNFDANVDDDQVIEEGMSWNYVHVLVSFSVGSNLDGTKHFMCQTKIQLT